MDKVLLSSLIDGGLISHLMPGYLMTQFCWMLLSVDKSIKYQNWQRKIFLFSTASRPAVESTQPPIQWVPGALFPGVKRLGREADYSPPSSAGMKKIGAVSPLPHKSTLA
jgi:hypothetical protein